MTEGGEKPGILNRDVDTQASWRALGVFLVVLVALALSWGATQGSTVVNPARADAGQYVLYAWNLKYQGVYSRSDSGLRQDVTPAPDAVRTPGYPLFLLPFMPRQLTPAIFPPIQTAQSLLVGAAVLVAFLLFRCFMPYWPALGAAGLAAISPHLANSAVYLLTESLFALMVALSLWLMARLLRRPGMLLAVLAGLAMGYGGLVRPTLQYLPLFVLPVLWWHLEKPDRVRVVGAVAAGFLVLYGAWGVRNLASTGQWSDPTLAAGTVQHGMYPDMMYEGDPKSRGLAYRFDPADDAMDGDMSAVLSTLWQRASAEPGRYLGWYLLGKPVTFWQWDIIAGQGDIFVYPTTASPYMELWPFKASHWLSKVLHWPAVLLAALGCVLAFAARHGDRAGAGAARLVAMTLFYFTALHMVGAPYPRYSIPVRPELFGMAVFTGWFVWQRLFADRNR